jgi:23S rRNA (adenine2503-C2)-methyltransferase
VNLLLDLALPELESRLSEWRQPAYRARQVWEWVYGRGVSDFGQMINLPASLRDLLQATFSLDPFTPVAESLSSDGQTRKLALRLPGGEAIETVWMRYETRESVCVSTQAGCAMGCVFCATGQGGLRRNLTAGEIVAQVLTFSRTLGADGGRVSNVVFMGMGEPFANYDAVWKAVRILTDPAGLGLGARRLVISTVGSIPGIQRFAGEKSQVRLAVSLHATDDALRNRLVPINQKYPIGPLMDSLHDYVNKTGRRLTFEYALIAGVNDSTEQARALASLLKGLPAHVNMIPLNPTPDSPFRPSPGERVRQFQTILQDHNIPCTVRLGRGTDIQAACGQLRAQTISSRK